MNKFLKKTALIFPPIKKIHMELVNLRNENQTLRMREEQICGENERLNVQLGRSVYLLDKLDKQHEDLVESLWNEGGRKHWICKRPFTSLNFDSSGEVFTCCANWLKLGNRAYSLGNIFNDSFETIWNSDKAKKLRYSVSQGNFEYCTSQCPYLLNPSLYPYCMIPRENAEYHYDKWQDCLIETSPTEIECAFDFTCNLYCLICRNKIHSNSDLEIEKVDSWIENFIRPALRDCETLRFDGRGEFLASRSWERFLKTLSKEEFPKLELAFMTNGQLFTPERWGKFSNLKGMRIGVSVSIDAASKDVYEKIRRGGRWETLCSNMEYIKSLKASGDINWISINFVVQKHNFHQLEDFVRLGKNWNVNTILLQRLININSSSPAAYAEQDVFHPDNVLRTEAIQRIKKLIRETVGVKIMDVGCLE